MSWACGHNLKIAFVGTGAQGASIGADFALAGLDVTFIEQWPEHVDAMNERGNTVNMPSRPVHAKVRVKHLCQVAEMREPFDLVFLVVKAYDTGWTCQLIKPVLASDGLVVGVQNGMTQHAIASVVGAGRTVGAVFDMASNMFTPGVTNRQNDHDTCWFSLGAIDPTNRQRVETIAELPCGTTVERLPAWSMRRCLRATFIASTDRSIWPKRHVREPHDISKGEAYELG
ncbi:NAD(P)-binding domain-containing protein [Rhizobium sp. 3T7]|uniref:ketopantoate reductase family protein n=1 Tax=Rhizobium sp. 3T7 TaxID=2874922 RepID=UPI001CC9179F|nr:2-dehydropantoate 2-reductase N-terminal domain-containing protein [Rhizobium sp. 3T7]MBZ9793970.1 NAD(P)-binding domain-containing protein [Rhizobium sp. 3T7]